MQHVVYHAQRQRLHRLRTGIPAARGVQERMSAHDTANHGMADPLVHHAVYTVLHGHDRYAVRFRSLLQVQQDAGDYGQW